MEIMTVLWREFVFFKKMAFKITSAALVTPILYLIAFGWGLGSDIQIEGATYMQFIIPGVIALSTTRTSFSAVSIRITVSKLTEKSFEYYLTAPIKMYMLTLGHILAGALRGLYAGVMILIISMFFGVKVNVNFWFFVICFLNSFLFASFGYMSAMMIDNHYDMNRFTSFVITPMTFLCGTFFSLEKIPDAMKMVIKYLPLSFTTSSLRGIALGNGFEFSSIVFLAIYSLIFYYVGVRVSYREV